MQTIAAIATAPICGPIGIIRLSGDDAIEILDKVFTPANGEKISKSNDKLLVYGNLTNKYGKIIDCCLACIMRAPNSYTGENTAEIQCHGSVEILNQVLLSVFSAGAVQAGPGEFTKRAFLNGKMDLSGAEAVNDLINAKTAQAAENASKQILGAVGGKIKKIRDDIVSVVANFHAVVDFPDEEIDVSLFDRAQEILHNATGELYAMAESYEKGRIIRDGVTCAILGKPNVGKSSILNALAGYERAIVTDIPGTTRDIVEENIRIGSILLHLSDTAGIRETLDPVEKLGIKKAMNKANEAAIVLGVFDASTPISDDDLMVIGRANGRNSIAIINKTDLDIVIDIEYIKKHFKHTISISVKNGKGLDKLIELIERVIGVDDLVFNGELITNARQAAALARAAERCEASFFAAQSGMTPDAVVMDAEGAIAALGEITGQSVTDDIVSKIFQNFCVGK